MQDLGLDMFPPCQFPFVASLVDNRLRYSNQALGIRISFVRPADRPGHYPPKAYLGRYLLPVFALAHTTWNISTMKECLLSPPASFEGDAYRHVDKWQWQYIPYFITETLRFHLQVFDWPAAIIKVISLSCYTVGLNLPSSWLQRSLLTTELILLYV